MDNPETMATLDIHDTEWCQTKQKHNTEINVERTKGAIKNGQSSDNGNIGLTRHRMKSNKTKTQKGKLISGAWYVFPYF